MLSQEDKSKLTEGELQILFQSAAYAAQKLGHRLVTGERNPDPKEHLNAPNPAHPGATRIRLLRPRPRLIWVDDAQDVKDHNSFVGSLGTSGTRFTP